MSGLLAAKEASGKSFTVIANELGLTNAYVANLFMNQARLTEQLSPALQAAVPGLTAEQLAAMQRCPMRSFNEAILQVVPELRPHSLRQAPPCSGRLLSCSRQPTAPSACLAAVETVHRDASRVTETGTERVPHVRGHHALRRGH